LTHGGKPVPTKTDPVIPDAVANEERRACFRAGYRLFYKFEIEQSSAHGEQFVCSVQLHPHSVVARAQMASVPAEHIQCEQRFVDVRDAPVAFADAVQAGLDLIGEVG
jgi:hypothetical protein